jgi:hypothetical protein
VAVDKPVISAIFLMVIRSCSPQPIASITNRLTIARSMKGKDVSKFGTPCLFRLVVELYKREIQ